MKKLGVIALLLVGGYWLACRTNVGSYIATYCSILGDKAEKAVPIDVELARLRHEVKQLDNDFQQLISRIAERKTDVAELKTKVEKNRARLNEMKADNLAMIKALKSGEVVVSLRGEFYPAEDVQARLTVSDKAYKTGIRQLASDQSLLKSKTAALDSSMKQLRELRTKKTEFENELAELEAEAERVKQARIVTRDQEDSTRRGNIESGIKKLRHRLTTESNKVELNNEFRTNGNVRPGKAERTESLTDLEAFYNGKK